MVRITKCVNNLFINQYRLMAKAGYRSAGAGASKPVPIELRMVPKYLELATFNGKDRFNSQEITEISELIKKRKSRGISPTELIKFLLDIGKEKNNILSAKEIKDFFEATYEGYDKNGQTRILRFMKALKEGQKPAQQTFWGVLSDNKSFIQGRPNSTSDFVSYSNRLYTKSVSQCEKPEILARVAEITGNHDKFWTAHSANSLAELYELTDGNAALILDCSRAFYPFQISKIVSEMKRPGYKIPQYELPETKPDYAVQRTSYSSTYTAEQQAPVLEKLNLNGVIKIVKDDEYIDLLGSRKMIGGNFEGGKRR